jgi:hypothetical protein
MAGDDDPDDVIREDDWPESCVDAGEPLRTWCLACSYNHYEECSVYGPDEEEY